MSSRAELTVSYANRLSFMERTPGRVCGNVEGRGVLRLRALIRARYAQDDKINENGRLETE